MKKIEFKVGDQVMWGPTQGKVTNVLIDDRIHVTFPNGQGTWTFSSEGQFNTSGGGIGPYLTKAVIVKNQPDVR